MAGANVPANVYSSAVCPIVHLEANTYEKGRLLHVQGKVKNMSQRPVRGYLLLHLVDSNQQSVYALRTEIQDKSQLAHNDTGSFEEVINIQALKGLKTVRVEFVELM
jgi:hypothetical protein